MGISKSCVYPSISVIAPNLASSLTLGRWNNYLDDGFLMQQSRGFASKKVGLGTAKSVERILSLIWTSYILTIFIYFSPHIIVLQ